MQLNIFGVAVSAAAIFIAEGHSLAANELSEGIYRMHHDVACTGNAPSAALLHVVRIEDLKYSGRIEYEWRSGRKMILLLSPEAIDGRTKLIGKAWSAPNQQEPINKAVAEWVAGSYLVSVSAKDWRCFTGEFRQSGSQRKDEALLEQKKYETAANTDCKVDAARREDRDFESATNLAAAATICQTDNFAYLTKVGSNQVFKVDGEVCTSSLFGMPLRTHHFQNTTSNCKVDDSTAHCDSEVYMFCRTTGSRRDLKDCAAFNLIFKANVAYNYESKSCSWKATSFKPVFGTVRQNPNAR